MAEITKEDIIQTLEAEIKGQESMGTDPDQTSHHWEEGILLSINQAKYILSLLKPR